MLILKVEIGIQLLLAKADSCIKGNLVMVCPFICHGR